MAGAPVTLDVDATDIDHRLIRVRERPTVQAGTLTLRFPRWMPGTQSPAGTVGRLAGLQMQIEGFAADADAVTRVEWHRDPSSGESVQVTIPAGAGTLNIAFE